MTRWTICLITTLCVLLPCLVVAQDNPTEATGPKQKADLRKMYEDIEILRRLLRKKLGDLYSVRARALEGMAMMSGGTGSMSSLGISPDGATLFIPAVVGDKLFVVDSSKSVQLPTLDLDGVYLKGYGIVVTVTLPEDDSTIAHPHLRSVAKVSCTSCHAANAEVQKNFVAALAKQPKPLSEWEKTRRDVLGIKTDGKPKSPKAGIVEVCAPGTVAELILHVLSDNGRHLSQLPKDEKVTVAVTFRSRRRASVSRFGAMGIGDGGMMFGSGIEDQQRLQGGSGGGASDDTQKPRSDSGFAFPGTEGGGLGSGDLGGGGGSTPGLRRTST
ncbi:MAG: hypothetical protein IH991_20805, partial [Planctomycetes bacterium]|nr:hypothetical protein [Planctomycetota bacterium]